MTVEDVATRYGDEIVSMGLGRRALAAWLSEKLNEDVTAHFARRVLAEVADRIYEREDTVPEKMQTKTMEQILRETYGLEDPTWVPVSVWGDPRSPRAKWERRLDLLDAEKMKGVVESLGSVGTLPSHTVASSRDQVAVLSIRDTHFGMFTEHPGEYVRYDLEEAQRAYESAALYLMEKAVWVGVSHLVIPFGSDALHVDGPQSTTTRGTPQEVSTAWHRAFKAALTSLNKVVSRALELFDVVTLVLEPGNHDHTLAQALGIAIESRWEGECEVLAGAETLKRVSVGKTHLFFHHGDSMKPNSYHGVIYSDYPECATPGAYIEVMSGHLHHRRKTVLLEPGDYLEENGIVFRITPALCPSSNWAESMGFRSKSGAQLTMYDEIGFVGMFEWTPNRT